MDAALDAHYVEHCKNVLKQRGYVVIPQERRVIITANFLVPPHEVEYSRLNSERFADMALAANQQRLIREAAVGNLIIHERKNVEDTVVFSSSIGIIKPKE